MGNRRTAWHFFFAILLRKRGSSAFDVRDEVPLSEEAPRMDYLLLQKKDVAPIDTGQTLRGLWPRLPQVTIAELKSLGRPYRGGELDRLFGYAHLYFADVRTSLGRRAALGAVLFVPTRTPSLLADVAEMGLLWVDLGGGYWQLQGALFQTFVVELGPVADDEDDDMLRLFGRGQASTLEASRFWADQVGTEEANMAPQDLEDYDDIIQRFMSKLTPEQRLAGLAPEQRVAGLAPEQRLAGLAPEQRVAGLAPEQRLAGLAPEQRVAGLDPEQVLLTLPDATLRSLSDEYLATLSPATRETIRQRVGR